LQSPKPPDAPSRRLSYRAIGWRETMDLELTAPEASRRFETAPGGFFRL
jgi:hypothetical protein